MERFFGEAPTTYRDEATGGCDVSVYPKKLGGAVASIRAKLRQELQAVRDAGLELGSGRVTIRPLRAKSWADSWKHHFKPINVGGVLLVKPDWMRDKPRPGQHVILLNPGLSFGTGHHPTTLFCLERLIACRKTGQNQSFLDVGTGSGILAIAAAKLGYATVEAFDYDPVAVRVARENLRRNRVDDRVRAWRQDLVKLRGKARPRRDVICANLVYDLLATEASTIGGWLKPGGRLIVAGILERQFDSIVTILCRFGLTLVARKTEGTWQSGEFVLRGP